MNVNLFFSNSFPHATDKTLLAKFKQQHQSNKYFVATPVMEPAFVIRHFAGNVKYQIKVPINLLTSVSEINCEPVKLYHLLGVLSLCSGLKLCIPLAFSIHNPAKMKMVFVSNANETASTFLQIVQDVIALLGGQYFPVIFFSPSLLIAVLLSLGLLHLSFPYLVMKIMFSIRVMNKSHH